MVNSWFDRWLIDIVLWFITYGIVCPISHICVGLGSRGHRFYLVNLCPPWPEPGQRCAPTLIMGRNLWASIFTLSKTYGQDGMELGNTTATYLTSSFTIRKRSVSSNSTVLVNATIWCMLEKPFRSLHTSRCCRCYNDCRCSVQLETPVAGAVFVRISAGLQCLFLAF